MRVLVTRPEPDVHRTAQMLRDGGHAPFLAPMLRFEIAKPLVIPIKNCGGVIATSANALRAVEEHPQLGELRQKPLFAVGTRTANDARKLGFRMVEDAGGDAEALVRTIGAFAPFRGILVYLAAEDRAHDLAAALGRYGVVVHTAVMYRMTPLPALQTAARVVLAGGQIDAVLHYSRRTAESYLACAAREGLTQEMLAPAHLCLSEQVAEPLLAAGATQVQVAPQPDEASLLQLLA